MTEKFNIFLKEEVNHRIKREVPQIENGFK